MPEFFQEFCTGGGASQLRRGRAAGGQQYLPPLFPATVRGSQEKFAFLFFDGNHVEAGLLPAAGLRQRQPQSVQHGRGLIAARIGPAFPVDDAGNTHFIEDFQHSLGGILLQNRGNLPP